MGSVAIHDWGVTVGDLAGVVHDDNLGEEGLDLLGWVVLEIRGDVSSLDILDGHVLHVESDVISGLGLSEDFVMHLDGLAISADTDGGEPDSHTGLEDTGLDSTNGYSTDTTDLVNILKG